MREINIEDQIYLCKYHDIISDSDLKFTMKLSRDEANKLIDKYKNNGLYEQYRQLSEDEYENLIQNVKSEKEDYILQEFKFKEGAGYKYFIRLIRASSKVKKVEKYNLTSICRDISHQLGVKDCVVKNECQRMLNDTYGENKNVFKAKGYEKKPSLKEFLVRELGIKCKEDETVIDDRTGKEESTKLKFTGKQTKVVEDYVIVSIQTLLDYSYCKGRLEAIEELFIKKNSIGGTKDE